MKKILVVDDDRLFRAAMKHHLQQLGYQVLENDLCLGVKQKFKISNRCLSHRHHHGQTGRPANHHGNLEASQQTQNHLRLLQCRISGSGHDQRRRARLLKPVTPGRLAAALHKLLEPA